jgi:Kae1-associated kinase Bud32
MADNMKKIAEGAEAKIYKVSIFETDMILKNREAKNYRIKKLDEELRRKRTRMEARVMSRVNDAGIAAPRVIAVGKYSIYMELLKGVLMKDMKLNKQLMRKVGKSLAKLHDNDVVHGDFTPANIIVNRGRVIVFDFGISEISNGIEEKALDVLLMKRSLRENMYYEFIKGYDTYQKSRTILRRLRSIEERGRYQSRTLS